MAQGFTKEQLDVVVSALYDLLQANINPSWVARTGDISIVPGASINSSMPVSATNLGVATIGGAQDDLSFLQREINKHSILEYYNTFIVL